MLRKPTQPGLVQEVLDGVRAKMAEGFNSPEDMKFFRSAMASSIASVLGLLRAAGEESDSDYEALKALLMELRGTGKVSSPQEYLLQSDPWSLLSDQFWPGTTKEVRMQKPKRQRKPKGKA
jgi:hypothetical protein